MMEQFNYCLVVGQTDVGRKRTANEDNMGNAVTQNGLVSVVCDGMGGHVGGATASRIAVGAILENLNANYYEDPRIAIGESIDIANRAILSEAAAHPDLTGMGSTCVLLIVRSGKVYIGHVGDSRIYLIRSKTIKQLTKDHSYVQMLVDRGEITKEQAEHHHRKNEITNALGIPNMTPATVADDAITPEAGDCFLLCSDGLSGMVSDATISKVVSRQGEMTPQTRVDRLIAIANENGGLDNITAQMVEFTVTPESVKPDKKLPLWLKISVPVVALAAVGAGAYFWLQSRNGKGGDDDQKIGVVQSVADTSTVAIAKVKFEPNTEVVSLAFKDSSLTFIRGGKQVYSDSYSFNPDSMTVTPSCIDVVLKEGARVLKFTDVEPEGNIVITIPVRESPKVCKYVIAVTSGKVDPDIPNLSNGGKSMKPAETTSKPEDTPVEADTINVIIAECQLIDGTKLMFSYSAKPFFKINDKENALNNNMFIDEVKNAEIIFDKTCWKKEFTLKNHQLIFTYKGTAPASSEVKLSIPCFKKGTKEEVILKVTLRVAAGAPEVTEPKVEPPVVDTLEPEVKAEPAGTVAPVDTSSSAAPDSSAVTGSDKHPEHITA